MVAATTTYLVVKSVHVMAAFSAYGLPLAYPMLLPYMRRRHPHAMPGVHDVQHRLNKRLTGPGTVLLFALGVYLTSKGHHWGEAWVQVPLAIIFVIAVAGGYVVYATGRLAELAHADVHAAQPGGEVAWGAEYRRLYRRYMAVELTLGLLVLVAIFFMAAKPFS